MKINVVNTKMIKPCTPTPQNLSRYKISFMDEFLSSMNVGIILFYYPTISKNNPQGKTIHQLEESLSEILPQFYPLAGRYMKNDGFVDCNDQGAEFIEAQVVDDDVDFIGLVSTKEMKELKGLFPHKFYQTNESPIDPLLSIQITEFKCGGLVISVSASHRIFDASSVGTFLVAWSTANHINPGGNITISPSFESILLFPGFGPSRGQSLNAPIPHGLVVKRFSFNKDAIANVRSKLIARPNYYYSRVRVVCAVIVKALIEVDRAKRGGKSRPCLIIQPVNMRGRTIPPLPKYSCGNLVTWAITQCMSKETDYDDCNNIIGIQELIDSLGDSVGKAIAYCGEILSPGGNPHTKFMEHLADSKKLMSGDVNIIKFSDWSKFGFYKTDFGWGKPLGAAGLVIRAGYSENTIILMDSKEGDAIEAWVPLNPIDMSFFDQDQDIKLLAT